jgi:hypothetical protein
MSYRYRDIANAFVAAAANTTPAERVNMDLAILRRARRLAWAGGAFGTLVGIYSIMKLNLCLFCIAFVATGCASAKLFAWSQLSRGDVKEISERDPVADAQLAFKSETRGGFLLVLSYKNKDTFEPEYDGWMYNVYGVDGLGIEPSDANGVFYRKAKKYAVVYNNEIIRLVKLRARAHAASSKARQP